MVLFPLVRYTYWTEYTKESRAGGDSIANSKNYFALAITQVNFLNRC